MAKDRLVWDEDGRDWPNRASSRFVAAAGIKWHVQMMGQGPVMLLLHGTGAATHSWRDLMPLLAAHFTIVAPDLPGHGFTSMPERRRMGLPSMASAVATLLRALDMTPQATAGHSAGAAVALRLHLDGSIPGGPIVSLNGALMPFPGIASIVYPALAKLLFLNPFAAPLLTRRAGIPGETRRLIEGTGSKLDETGIGFYERLFSTRRHVAAAVSMMANWDLRSLRNDLSRVTAPVSLISGELDRAVPPQVARDAAKLLSDAAVIDLPGLGHLAHEESPRTVANLILDETGKSLGASRQMELAICMDTLTVKPC